MIHGPATLNQPVTIIYLRRTLLPGSSSLPESRPVTDRHCFLFGLASDGVYLATWVTPNAGELLPHRFTLTQLCATVSDCRALPGGLFSVALIPSLATGRRYRPSCPKKPGLSSRGRNHQRSSS